MFSRIISFGCLRTVWVGPNDSIAPRLANNGFSVMKAFWTCTLIFVTVLVHSQTVPKFAETAQSHLSMVDFGLVYPLSSDWVRATEMLRKKIESANSQQNFDVLLAAVYVPKSNFAPTSPFFSVFAYRQPATDCKKNLEAMIAHSQGKGEQLDGSVVKFSVADRDYYRVSIVHSIGGRHECLICTIANQHLLLWNAGAPNEKGLDAIVATLNSITPLPQGSAAQSGNQKAGEPEDETSRRGVAEGQRVKVASGVTTGLLVKKVNPTYPAEARAAHIQGTVLLKAEISTTGDIIDLELLDGPIELAGSAVAAVRQWKYKPYLLMGQPVTVMTQIQVNYQLR